MENVNKVTAAEVVALLGSTGDEHRAQFKDIATRLENELISDWLQWEVSGEVATGACSIEDAWVRADLSEWFEPTLWHDNVYELTHDEDGDHTDAMNVITDLTDQTLDALAYWLTSRVA